jgi:uncharacterized membrane protein
MSRAVLSRFVLLSLTLCSLAARAELLPEQRSARLLAQAQTQAVPMGFEAPPQTPVDVARVHVEAVRRERPLLMGVLSGTSLGVLLGGTAGVVVVLLPIAGIAAAVGHVGFGSAYGSMLAGFFRGGWPVMVALGAIAVVTGVIFAVQWAQWSGRVHEAEVLLDQERARARPPSPEASLLPPVVLARF